MACPEEAKHAWRVVAAYQQQRNTIEFVVDQIVERVKLMTKGRGSDSAKVRQR